MINADRPDRWKADAADSVEMYNSWFLEAAPKAYRDTRAATAKTVSDAFALTDNLASITVTVLRENPEVLATLRMSTAPPIARDRLSGLAGVPKSMVKTMEEGAVPPRMKDAALKTDLQLMCDVLSDLLDLDLYPWLAKAKAANNRDLEMATTVVADRLCGSVADPIVRNAQEQRQLAVILDWLEKREYRRQAHPPDEPLSEMEPGTYSFRMNVATGDESHSVNIPIDAVVQPHQPFENKIPLLIEAKSAGDFTNTNKRRKEEATKVRQLRDAYGDDVRFILFLCGYFDSGYLGYEAAEGIDWVWEHRIDDLGDAGV